MDNEQIKLQLLYDKLKKDEADSISAVKSRTQALIGSAIRDALANGMRKGDASAAVRAYSNWSRFKSYLDAAPETFVPDTEDVLEYEWDGRTATFFSGWSGFDRSRLPTAYQDTFEFPEKGIRVDFDTEGGYSSTDSPEFVFASRDALNKIATELGD